MKRKVAQRRTQCAYAHARLHSGSEEYDKVRRTGHTLCSAGVPRVTLPCSLQIAAIARRAQDLPQKAVKPFFSGTNRYSTRDSLGYFKIDK
jgi:hypothetical protein